MSETEEHTCGRGIAANAVLPEKLSVVLRGMADVQENHIRGLDPKEANGKTEIEAYQRLVSENRAVANRLDALASLMRGYRNLPMPSHNMDVLMDKRSSDVFAAFVAGERELLDLMQGRVKEWDGMLEAMREA
jgi:hypothetical protein